MANDIQDAIRIICEEKNIKPESVIATIEAALAAAFRKDFGQKNQNLEVKFDPKTSGSRVFDVKTVVEDVDLEELEEKLEAQREKKEAGEEIPEDEEIKRFNPKTELMLTEAKELKKDAKIGDEIRSELDIPDSYGRMAAQTAKQVIIQRLREAERENTFNEFKELEGELINGVVQRFEGRNLLVDIGQTTAIMRSEDQVRNERYASGTRMKFFLVSVAMTSKGPEIVVSRSHAGLVEGLFATEVPEINAGTVIIRGVAREAGNRVKIAVSTEEDNIDPVGSCVGQRGTRVQTVISELNGEKIDIIEYAEDPEKYIINALSPAKVQAVELNEENKTALVRVKDDQLSLAIGRAGQNVRLASKLTDWKLDIATEDGTVHVSDNNEAEKTQSEESGEEEKKEESAEEDKKDKKEKTKSTKGETEDKEKEESTKEEKKTTKSKATSSKKSKEEKK